MLTAKVLRGFPHPSCGTILVSSLYERLCHNAKLWNHALSPLAPGFLLEPGGKRFRSNRYFTSVPSPSPRLGATAADKSVPLQFMDNISFSPYQLVETELAVVFKEIKEVSTTEFS